MPQPPVFTGLLFFPESLKDLVRFLRRDDTTCEIRRQLGYSEVLQNVSNTVCLKMLVHVINNDLVMVNTWNHNL